MLTPDMIFPIIFSCIYVLGILLFFVIFLAEGINHRPKLRHYWRYGLAFALGILAIKVVVLILSPEIALWIRIANMIGLIVAFFNVILFTSLGMYYCDRLGVYSFPLFRSQYPIPEDPLLTNPWPTEGLNTAGEDKPPLTHMEAIDMEAMGTEYSSLSEEPVAVSLAEVEPDLEVREETPAPEETAVPPTPVPHLNATPLPTTTPSPTVPAFVFNARNYLGSIAAVVVTAVIYTFILFSLTQPHVSDIIQPFLRNNDTTVEINLRTLIFVFSFALSEELIFRLAIQNYLAYQLDLYGQKYGVAILITTILWTLGHSGALDPGWVKYAQIFPFGLMLGWLYKKQGVESCIIAHGLINIILAFFSNSLIQS